MKNSEEDWIKWENFNRKLENKGKTKDEKYSNWSFKKITRREIAQWVRKQSNANHWS